MPTRREFIAGSATAVASAVGVTALSSTAAAYVSQPEYVTITFDESWLETYKPYVVTRQLDIEPSSWYAWRVDSTEQETSMAVYYCYYVSQQGVSKADSHPLDREPVMVEITDSGNIEAIHVDGYHYLNKTYPTLETAGGSRPLVHSVKPWHFYRSTTEIGADLQLEDLGERFEPWLENGWSVYPEAVTNPWIVPQQRGHYWDDGLGGFAYSAQRWETVLEFSQTVGLNIGGAQEADL